MCTVHLLLKINGSWKIRQAAVHHQLDIGSGIQLWLFGDPHAAIKDRITEIINANLNYREKYETVAASFKSSLNVHLEIARWSTQGWRLYLLSLEETVETLTSKFVFRNSPRSQLDTDDLFRVQEYEGKVNETVMVLESNGDNLESLRNFYIMLVEESGFPTAAQMSCRGSVKQFCSQLHELIYDVKMQIRRANILVKTVADRKAIFIQFLQTETAVRAEGLSATMWRQTEKASQEAIAMRIITVITLIYLPPTFVSLFPFAWYKHEGVKMKKRAASMEKEFPDVFNETPGLTGSFS
ncbi:hypothetical protein SLS62_004025 [Diatrype stigma]|uniref:CorA-like transporter domain-containing protein n=1 Tax=Diatrype stigma TaxID=117547 RepID=A0AAN9UV94_9PEZI